MSALNWQKNFGHISTRKSAAPSTMPKFWTTVAPVIFEIFSKKIFWVVFGPIWVTQLKEFKISPKKQCFEIFQVALESRWNLSSSWAREVLDYNLLKIQCSHFIIWDPHQVCKIYTKARTTQVSPGLQSYLKNFKMPFFLRYSEFLQLGNLNRSKNDPPKK